MEKTVNAIIGSAGIAVVNAVSSVDPSQISDIAQAVVSIIIGIVTLFGLLKKKS